MVNAKRIAAENAKAVAHLVSANEDQPETIPDYSIELSAKAIGAAEGMISHSAEEAEGIFDQGMKTVMTAVHRAPAADMRKTAALMLDEVQQDFTGLWHRSLGRTTQLAGEFQQCRSLPALLQVQQSFLSHYLENLFDSGTTLLKLSGKLSRRATTGTAS